VGTDRAFGLAGSVLLTGLFVIEYLRAGDFPWWIIAVAGVLAACALGAPSALAPLNRAWVGLRQLLSRITSAIVFAAAYWLAVVPAGLIRRSLWRDRLPPGFDKAAPTYWSRRPPEIGDMKNQV
jgi:hypothetical protein